MNKDIIYIDVEDDITAIIGKIKASKDRIVALVPPKRIGVLQSAVNLRLLSRTADTANKHLVLITNNQALIALSAVAKIPVAKNLQSKPEIAEIAAIEIDDGEDVIDGAQIPVGELAKTADLNETDAVSDAIVMGAIDIENEGPQSLNNSVKQSFKPTPRSTVKVPDFSRFRKKLFIGLAITPFVIAFFVWAIWFAPAAKVIITTNTSAVSISLPVKLGGSAATDISKDTIQTISKQIQKNVSVTFTPTGQQNVGNKASGTITVENCDNTNSFTIAANTVFTADSGQSFANANSAVVPGFTGSASACEAHGTGAGTVDIPVTAAIAGTSSNIAATSYSITGVDGNIYANGGQMSGGTDQIVTAVSASDIQTATQALANLSTNIYKQQLTSEFTNGEFVIPESFNVVYGASVSSPAVGAQATTATLTSQTTFSIVAIAKSEVEAYLKDSINKQISGNSQRIYSDGIDNAKVSCSTTDQGCPTNTVNINATGQIGPNINDASIKQQIKGKQFGDAQAILSGINGVNNVNIKFSYFWVNTIPSDVNKIDVQFVLQND